jgi:hypothetical protein
MQQFCFGKCKCATKDTHSLPLTQISNYHAWGWHERQNMANRARFHQLCYVVFSFVFNFHIHLLCQPRGQGATSGHQPLHCIDAVLLRCTVMHVLLCGAFPPKTNSTPTASSPFPFLSGPPLPHTTSPCHRLIHHS